MNQEKINYDELKKSGYIVQKDPDYFTVRLRVPAGLLSSKQTIALGKIANKYGRGEIHLTVRQGIQIPWVKFDKLGKITKELIAIGTPPGSCGPRVRNISACVGLPECPYANIDTSGLARKIDKRFFDRVLPTKLKLAITGCPNSCAKPQVNDIGVMGVVKPRIISERCDGCGICVRICKEGAIKILNGKAHIDFTRCIYCGECIRICPKDADVSDKQGHTIFVGGNIGRHPKLAYKIIDFADEETIYKVIENSIQVFAKEGAPRERFGHLIDRLGIGEFVKMVL
ncbi:MAG: 4Fe-4S binding protein [Candidatus Methanofastidiosia archaeon]